MAKIPFATVDDLIAGWPDMPEDLREHADVILERVSYYIAGELKNHGIDYENADQIFEHNLKTVTCEAAQRVISTPAERLGATQYTESAVGYSETATYNSNGGGAIYLTKTERKMLGLIGRSTFGIIEPYIGLGQS